MPIKLGVKISRGRTEVTYCNAPDINEVKRLWREGHSPIEIKEILKRKGQKDAARVDGSTTRTRRKS